MLITAGPTREPIDGVRYISNRSSGKMGYAIAEQAALRGAIVILISGPVRLETPQGVTRVDVESAVEMREAVMDHLEAATIVIKAAAVADYYVANAAATKIKKTQARLTLDLEPTPDILAELGTKKGDRLLIGFAAETDNLVNEARRKLNAKNCDMVVGNLVAPPAMNSQARGFDADENEVVLVTRMGDTIAVERAPKRVIADRILNEIPRLRLAAHAKA